MITSYHIHQKTNLLSVSQGLNLLVQKGSSFQVSHVKFQGCTHLVGSLGELKGTTFGG